MSIDEDIVDKALDGGSYQKAQLLVRRTFRMPIDRKVQIAAVAAGTTVPFGPAIDRRRAFIRTIEGIESVDAAVSPRVGTAAILGMLMTNAAGLLLVRQKYIVARRSPGLEEARRLVRLEDLLMWFVVLGAAFISIPVTVAVVGLVSTGAIQQLYQYGIMAYQPAETLRIPADSISVAGGISAAVLFFLQQRSPQIRPDR